MAFPYAMWPPPSQLYAVPATSPPLVSGMYNQYGDPSSFVRDHLTRITGGNSHETFGPQDDWFIDELMKHDDHKKIIYEVCKERLGLGWPYCYKAMQVLEHAPNPDLLQFTDALNKLNESAATVLGSAEIKKKAKPLLDKAKSEAAKKEAEEAKKKQEAIAHMWGGMWANDGYKAPALYNAGWQGFPWPYVNMPPGVQAAAQVDWNSKAPAGWNSSSITPMPTIYPFSRTGYMASYTEPTEEEKKKVEPWWVSVNLGRPPTSFPAMSKPLSTNVDEWYASLNAQLAARGW